MRAIWSTDSVFSLSLKPYVGTPSNRRSVTSRQAMTVGSVLSRIGNTTRKRPGSGSTPARRTTTTSCAPRPAGRRRSPTETRVQAPAAMAEIADGGQPDTSPWLRRSPDASSAQSPYSPSAPACAARRRANAAVADLNPFFDLVPKRVDQFTAVCRRGLPFASIARQHVARHRIRRAADQCGGVSIALRQIVGCQNLHDRLGRLHSLGPRSVRVVDTQ
jgi:hypothetical protein